MTFKKTSLTALLTCGLVLTSCETPQPDSAFTKKVPFSSLKAKRDIPPTIAYIFQLLKDEKFAEASQLINITLQTQPQNPILHILNGLTYERLVAQGDSSGIELAIIGYQTAINLDPSNLFAIVQLAKLHAREKNYLEAQELFANALLLKPKDPDLLHEFAFASYYAYDIKSALSAIEQARKLRPNDPLIHRSSAMIYAALGQKEAAEKHFKIFKQKLGDDPAIEQAHARLQDWDAFYKSGRVKPAKFTSSDTIHSAELDPLPLKSTSEETADRPNFAEEKELDEEAEKYGEDYRAEANNPQIIIDCYLLRISEETQTVKGQNILDNLAVTLTPGGFMSTQGFLKGSATDTVTASTLTGTPSTGFKSNQLATTNGGDSGGAASTFTSGALNSTFNKAGSISGRVFSLGLTWAGLTYNLNIANAIQTRSELVSRPSMMTFLKKQSTFFSGQELVLGLTGQYGGTLVKYPVGVTLIVTPTSLQDDLLTLNISIEKSFLVTDSPSLQNTVTVTKAHINTIAKVRLGETLMLSGIYERSEFYTKEGVPGLQDVPIVQYFFSSEATDSETISVVYMLTPRSPDLVKTAVNRAMTKHGDQLHLMELMGRNPDWFNSSPNFVPIFQVIKRNPIVYYEFRTGDLIPPSWGWEPTISNKLEQLESFLYF